MPFVTLYFIDIFSCIAASLLLCLINLLYQLYLVRMIIICPFSFIVCFVYILIEPVRGSLEQVDLFVNIGTTVVCRFCSC